jgi:hypothetical protein
MATLLCKVEEEDEESGVGGERNQAQMGLYTCIDCSLQVVLVSGTLAPTRQKSMPTRQEAGLTMWPHS